MSRARSLRLRFQVVVRREAQDETHELDDDHVRVALKEIVALQRVCPLPGTTWANKGDELAGDAVVSVD